LAQRTWVAKLVTVVAAFAVIQLAISLPLGSVTIFSDFDSGLLFQACTMAWSALGLNLIYGFNGQFSLGQWGFYGIGAYAAADITIAGPTTTRAAFSSPASRHPDRSGDSPAVTDS